jgi:stage II sporulation protein E
MLKEQTKAGKISVSRNKKESEIQKGIRLILPYKIILCLFISFIIADTSIGGAKAILAVSFAGVLSPLLCAASFVGSMLSFLAHGTLTVSVPAVTAIIALIISKIVICDIFKKIPASGANAVLTGSACLVCEIIVSLSLKISAVIIAAILCRSILCGLIAYFLNKAICSADSDGYFSLNKDNALSVSIVYILVVCALGSISFGYLNAGMIIGIAVILIASSRLSFYGGAIAAVLTSLGIALASPELGKVSVLLSCTALAAGLFCKAGKFSVTLVFVASNLIGLVLLGIPSDSQKFAADIIFGVILFLVIPEKLYIKLVNGIAYKQPASSKIISSRLDFAAKTLKDVRQSALLAAKAFERRMTDCDISSKVCGKVCSDCRHRAFCSEDDFHRTISLFSSAEALINVKGYLLEKDLPKGLESCSKKEELLRSFNELYRQSQIDKKRIASSSFIREISFEQLTASEEMLKNIISEITVFSGNDDNMSEKVRIILIAYGAKNPVVSVSYDCEGKVFIEAYVDGIIKSDTDKLTEKLSAVFDRDLEKPEITCIEKTTRLCFHEVPEYLLDIGVKKQGGKDSISGDSELIFSDGKGCTYFIISDGMGSGARAAVESRMTVTLLKKLLQGGVGFDAAFKLINLLLLAKSSDEMFATIDIMCINTFTGQTDILKLGAAQTFIKTNGSVKCIESFSTPVGIIGTVEFERRTAYLSDGDCAVMISDGVEDQYFPFINEIMLKSDISAEKSAVKIIESASASDCKYKDDITVFVVKFVKL